MDSLNCEGRLLAFVDAGSGAPPVLLIHDLGSDHRSLRRQVAYFRRQHRVVAVDLAGHGKSDGSPARHAVTGLAEDLDWLCRELGLYRPAAVGQGVGGMIAVELAARHPGLLSAVVAVDAPLLSSAVTRDDHAEASWDIAGTWDGARALTLCRAPILLIVTRLDHTDADTIRSLPRGVSVRVVEGSRLPPGEAAKRVNALIDTFLSGDPYE